MSGRPVQGCEHVRRVPTGDVLGRDRRNVALGVRELCRGDLLRGGIDSLFELRGGAFPATHRLELVHDVPIGLFLRNGGPLNGVRGLLGWSLLSCHRDELQRLRDRAI